MKNGKHLVVAIPDIHFPYHNSAALVSILDFIKEIKPDIVIQLGDLLDQYVFSKYSRKLSVTPSADILEGVKLAEETWENIQTISPESKCIQLMGNHDVRVSKRISEKLPELEDFFNHKSFYKLDGVTVLDSDRDYFECDGVYYVHGWLSKSIDHAKYFNAPVVHGHRHRACIEYDNENLWSMDCGFVADKNAMPLGYTMSKLSKWSTSFGVIEYGNPRLIKL